MSCALRSLTANGDDDDSSQSRFQFQFHWQQSHWSQLQFLAARWLARPLCKGRPNFARTFHIAQLARPSAAQEPKLSSAQLSSALEPHHKAREVPLMRLVRVEEARKKVKMSLFLASFSPPPAARRSRLVARRLQSKLLRAPTRARTEVRTGAGSC